MELSTLLAFAAVAFMVIVIPGPDWAFVLAAGARDRVVVPVVAGLVGGYALITAVVAVGVGPLLAGVPAALVGLTLAGAGYLVYVGVRALRSPVAVRSDDGAATVTSPPRYFTRGLGVSSLNPKSLLIFVAVLPQFAHPAAQWPAPVQLTALGSVWIAICAVIYLGLGHSAQRVLGSRPRVAVLITRIAGVSMIVVGLALVAERVVAVVA